MDYNFSPENTIIGWNFKKNPNSIITEKPSQKLNWVKIKAWVKFEKIPENLDEIGFKIQEKMHSEWIQSCFPNHWKKVEIISEIDLEPYLN